MPFVEFTDEDIKRGTLVDPGMYNVTVESFKEEKDKNGKPLYKYRYKIFGCDKPEFDAVTLFDQFSSLAMGFYKPFWEAVTQTQAQKGTPYDLEYPVGKSLRVNVIRDVYEGKPQNKVSGYAPYVG